MSTLMELQGQIEKLQKQASEIRSREFDKTVQDIREKMQAFGITVKDLQTRSRTGRGVMGGGKTSARKTSAKVKKPGNTAVAAKYKGPNGETWSGRGLTPRWLSALLIDGKTKADFSING